MTERFKVPETWRRLRLSSLRLGSFDDRCPECGFWDMTTTRLIDDDDVRVLIQHCARCGWGVTGLVAA